jgi:hypothetical protein
VADRFIEIVDRHEPDPATAEVYGRLFPVFQAAYTALCPIYDQLHALEEQWSDYQGASRLTISL